MHQSAQQQAAEPVIHRIRRDREQASEPVAKMLRDIGAKFLISTFDIDHLARACGSDWRDCHAIFAVELDTEPEDYLAEARLETALRLLEATDLDLATVGRLAGFGGADGLRQASKLYLDLAPSRLRDLFRHRRPGAGRSEPLPPPLPPGERARYAGLFADRMWRRLQTLSFERASEVLRHEQLLGEPQLFELLSRQSLRQGRRDPRRGVELAELALATVEGSAPILDHRGGPLRVLALVRLGGARRKAGDRDGAGDALDRAEAAWNGCSGPDPGVAAELWLQQGRLALAESRREDARELLGRALPIARVLGVEVQRAEAQAERPPQSPGHARKLRQDLDRLEHALVHRRPAEIR